MSVRSKNPLNDNSNFNYNSNSSASNNFRKPAGSLYGHDDEEDLSQIQQKIGKVENNSLESTQRALRMLNKTHEIGVGAAQVKTHYFKQLRILLKIYLKNYLKIYFLLCFFIELNGV